MKQKLKESGIDIILCKENFKKKLKDRYRVKGHCFSNSKYKKEFDSIMAKILKKEIKQAHFSYNEKLKNLVKSFKSIKKDIFLIEQKDKENKRIMNQNKILKDYSRISYDKLYDKLIKFERAKKDNNKYVLQKSKIFSDKKDYSLDDELKEYIENNKKNAFNNNTLNKINLTKGIYECELKKYYKEFFTILFKKNHSLKFIKNSQSKIKKVLYNNIKYKKSDSNISSKILINGNNNINDLIDVERNITSNFGNHEKIKNLKSFSNKHINYKNKLIKNLTNESNIYNNYKSSKYVSTELSINTNKINSNSFNSKSSQKKASKNINTNYFNDNKTKKIYKSNFLLNKKSKLNNMRILSGMSTITKANNKSNYYNTISNCNNHYESQTKRKKNKVIYKPIYTANIRDFVNNYNRIKKINKENKIKRKENHLSKYADIEKAFDLKEDMLMFLLKDKYINSQFPKNYIKKPNKRKAFIKNLTEKIEILDNPFNKGLKMQTINFVE